MLFSAIPRLALAALTLGLLLFAPRAAAQSPFDSFPTLNGPVSGLAVVGDTLYFGGDFDLVGPQVGHATAIDPETAAIVPGVVPFLEGSNNQGVRDIIPDGQGGLFIGSRQISTGPGVLIRVLPDGTIDPDFAPEPTYPSGQDGIVERLTLQGGLLFVRGFFSTIAGAERDGFAVLDAATGEIADFPYDFTDADGFGGLGSIVIRDNLALMAGSFDNVNGVPRDNFALVDLDTEEVLPFQAEFEGSFARLIDAGDTVYLFGSFEGFGGETRDNLAEIEFPDAADTAPTVTDWAPTFATETEPFIAELTDDVVLTEDYIWLGGDYTVGATEEERIYSSAIRFSRDDDDGFATQILTSTFDEDGFLGANALATDGETVWLSVRDRIDQFDTQSVVVGVDAETGERTDFELLAGFVPQGELRSRVRTMTFAGGNLIIGGNLLQIGSEFEPNFGSIDLTTGASFQALDEPFESPIGSLLPSPDGRRLYVGTGGEYIEIDLVTGEKTAFGVPYNGTDAVRAAADAPPAGSGEYTARKNMPAFATDDALYLPHSGVGGGGGRKKLRKVDPQTLAPDDAFELIYTGFLSEVVLFDGWLYLGGDFDLVNGTSGTNLSRVDPDTGELDLSFLPATEFNIRDIRAIEPAEGFFAVGGELTASAFQIVAYERPDANPYDWNATIGGSGGNLVRSIQYGADEVFYVSGDLDTANGEPRFRLAAFDRNGDLLEWPEDNAQPTEFRVELLVSDRHSRVFVGTSGDTNEPGRQGEVVYLTSYPTVGNGTAANDAPAADALVLRAAPNPVRGRVAFALTLPEASSDARVELFDALGRRVATLHEGPLPAGASELSFDASVLPAGVYVARATGADAAVTATITVVR